MIWAKQAALSPRRLARFSLTAVLGKALREALCEALCQTMMDDYWAGGARQAGRGIVPGRDGCRLPRPYGWVGLLSRWCHAGVLI